MSSVLNSPVSSLTHAFPFLGLKFNEGLKMKLFEQDKDENLAPEPAPALAPAPVLEKDDVLAHAPSTKRPFAERNVNTFIDNEHPAIAVDDKSKRRRTHSTVHDSVENFKSSYSPSEERAPIWPSPLGSSDSPACAPVWPVPPSSTPTFMPAPLDTFSLAQDSFSFSLPSSSVSPTALADNFSRTSLFSLPVPYTPLPNAISECDSHTPSLFVQPSPFATSPRTEVVLDIVSSRGLDTDQVLSSRYFFPWDLQSFEILSRFFRIGCCSPQ